MLATSGVLWQKSLLMPPVHKAAKNSERLLYSQSVGGAYDHDRLLISVGSASSLL